MQNEVRIGVIGTSWWADLIHLPGIKSHPQANLVAVCGRDRVRADEMAGKYDIPHVFTDYQAMIAQSGLDAVVISVPDDLHYSMTMAALDAGLHVMCEKPLARNAGEACAMYERAEAAEVKHGVFFTWAWLPHYQRILRLIESGYVGAPYHLSLRFLLGFGRSPDYSWRSDAGRSNGILGDLGSHMLQFARLYVGEVTRVCAHLGSHVERTAPDGQSFLHANDAATLSLEFANGAHGSLQVSGVAYVADRTAERHVVLHGSEGTIESSYFFTGAELRGARKGDSGFADLLDDVAGLEDPRFPFGVFFDRPIGNRAFIDAILNDTQFTPSFYDGWRVQQVVDAALRSHEEGRWVTV